MRWLILIPRIVASLAVVGLAGLTALILVSALTGHGLPFAGGFGSSDELLSFERLITKASDRGGVAERTDTGRSTSAPTATAAAPSPPDATGERSPASSPGSVAAAMPAALPAQEVPVGSDESAQSVGGATTLASSEAVESSIKAKGATTISWQSSFAAFDYALGDTVTITVNWTVDAGAASYDSFALKGYTSSSSHDPVEGTSPDVRYPGANGPTSIDVSFALTGLHLDAERNVEIGNGHFKLYLQVDVDGDGIPETLAGYGVNVHLEDPL